MILKDTEKVSISIGIVDVKGNPAPVDGLPAWTSSNEAVLALVVASDGMSAVSTAVGSLGTSQVGVSADADLGSGVTPIVGTLDIDVVASEAVAVNLVPGTPEPQ